MSPSIIQRSREMVEVMALARRVAPTEANVLITGESGTGKSLLAAEIHRRSARRDAAFVTIACANIPAELFESELFGHEAGAHTDASARRIGRVEAARGGTLFLDGVEALAPALQAKLLRVLQERSFERLGGTETIRVDVRWIAAATADLESAAIEGRFRQDLFYRLNVVHIGVPPLRERRSDIVPLAQALLKEISARHDGVRRTIAPLARKKLREYPWPGNVRELANVMERAIISGLDATVGPEALKLPSGPPEKKVLTQAIAGSWTLDALERVYIGEILRKHRGNKSRAASVLGIDRKTLLAKLKRSGG